MKITQSIVFALLIYACTFTANSACRADLILNPVGNIAWDRQGAAPQLVFSISANNNMSLGANSNNINSFNLIFSIRPTSGAIGTLGIQAVAPTSDSLFPVFSDLIFNPNFGNGFASIQGQNAITPPNLQPSNVTLAPGIQRNLVTLNITPTADAAGGFSVFLSNTSNYTFVNEFDGVAFANLPFTNPATEISLGTYSVSAVPEPSCAILIIGCMASSMLARRRSMFK